MSHKGTITAVPLLVAVDRLQKEIAANRILDVATVVHLFLPAKGTMERR